jgi:hypothetical protein
MLEGGLSPQIHQHTTVPLPLFQGILPHPVQSLDYIHSFFVRDLEIKDGLDVRCFPCASRV